MKTNFFQVAAFYKFIQLDDLDYMQDLFLKFLQSHNIKGTVLIANEGINGTISGKTTDIKQFKSFVKKLDLLSSSDFKISLQQASKVAPVVITSSISKTCLLLKISTSVMLNVVLSLLKRSKRCLNVCVVADEVLIKTAGL